MNMDTVNFAQESKYSRLLFFGMCGLVLLSSGAVYLTQLVYQGIADTFSVSLLEVTYAFSLCTLAYAVSFFIFGPLTNAFRTDKLLSFGTISLVLCLVSVSICSTYQIFLGISLSLGVVASSVSATIFSFVAKNSKGSEITQRMSILIAVSVVGIVSGRTVISILSDYLDWRYGFALYGVVSLAIFTIVIVLYPREDCTNNSFKLKNLQGIYFRSLKLYFRSGNFILFAFGFILFFSYIGVTSTLTYFLGSQPYSLSGKELGWFNMVGVVAVFGTLINSKLGNKLSFITISKVTSVLFVLSLVAVFMFENLYFILLGVFFLFLSVFMLQPIIIGFLSSIIEVEFKGIIPSLYLLSSLLGGAVGAYALGGAYEYLGWSGVGLICISSSIFLLLVTFNISRILSQSTVSGS